MYNNSLSNKCNYHLLFTYSESAQRQPVLALNQYAIEHADSPRLATSPYG